jgi:hypothetical protein
MDKRELEEVREMLTEMMLTSIGPMSAMTTSTYATVTDSLIDARVKFTNAGWPEWMIAEVLTAMCGGSTSRKRS